MAILMKFLLHEVRFLLSGLLFGFVLAILWSSYFKFDTYLLVYITD